MPVREGHGADADQACAVGKACEVYAEECAIAYPQREKRAGRPRLVTPLTDRLVTRGAVMGARGGWERAAATGTAWRVAGRLATCRRRWPRPVPS